MEYIDGRPLKEFINTVTYYEILKKSLKQAFLLDEKGVFHSQLGRYFHILYTGSEVRFIDFERAVFTHKPRNFMQLVGYYCFRDEKFDKKILNDIVIMYKKEREKALNIILKVIDDCKY